METGVGVPRATLRPAAIRSGFVRRILDDGPVLLVVALSIPILFAAAVTDPDELPRVVVATLGFGAAEAALRSARVPTTRWPGTRLRWLVRLVLAVGYVALCDALVGDVAFRLGALYVPVVVLAATTSYVDASLVGLLALLAYLLPSAIANDDADLVFRRIFVLIAATVIMVIGTRRTVSTLETALRRLRSAVTAERRRARRMAGVEAVGRLLAAEGATPAALDEVTALLVGRFGYARVSISLAEDPAASRLRLGAQRGHPEPAPAGDIGEGLVGEVIRTRAEIVSPDAAGPTDDPSAAGAVATIGEPLLAGDDLLGVVCVERGTAGELDDADLEAIRLVADRLASALALARQREVIVRRAARFQRLVGFSAAIAGTLEPVDLHRTIVRDVARALDADVVTLTVLERSTGAYRIEAIVGGEPSVVGTVCRPGQGLAGRAIASRTMVVAEELEGDDGADPLRSMAGLVLSAVAIPLIRDERVLGALTLARSDPDAGFDPDEREALAIVGHQAALAIHNSWLHEDVSDAAVRDSLTGLYNRRHLDASLGRLSASRARLEPDDRRPVSAILFDLDHFGTFNKRHGHRVGDEVLRVFARILLRRFRDADLVGRYGGEEFIVILDGARLRDATRIADEIRRELAATTVQGADGETLRTTVSAGCAQLPDDESSLDVLVGAADLGLAMAKRAGRDTVVAV